MYSDIFVKIYSCIILKMILVSFIIPKSVAVSIMGVYVYSRWILREGRG